MKAIVVTDQAAGPAAINDVIVQIHARDTSRLRRSGPRPGPIAATVTEHRRSSATSWPEWSPLSATARRDCR
jgi:hypothetical protein